MATTALGHFNSHCLSVHPASLKGTSIYINPWAAGDTVGNKHYHCWEWLDIDTASPSPTEPVTADWQRKGGWVGDWPAKTWEDMKWKNELSEKEDGVTVVAVFGGKIKESGKCERGKKDVLQCGGKERWWRVGVAMRLEGRRSQEADIGMDDGWMDGVQREQHGGWCILVTERGWSTSQCVTFLTLDVPVVSWKTRHIARNRRFTLWTSLCEWRGSWC